MENVEAFNNELSGLYGSKPPISKAKMAAITRAAMKAIKFYKHVVQSVEKFILKCKPEYKIPGLYVIDSIVRQSRHQFGPEKDVFAPRFARNVKSTFANLFRGVPEDKSRIIRVLNLWQKNNVFAPDVIQPLFDLADPNHPIYQLPPGTQDSVSDGNGMNMSMADNNMSASDDNHGIPDLSIGNAKTLDQSTLLQLQHIQQIYGVKQSESVRFNKKILDYDYGEEEEREDISTSPHVPNLLDGNNLTQLLKDPNVLRQLQTLQQYKKQQEEKQIKLNEMRIQEEAFEKHLQNVLKGTSGPSGMSGMSSNQSVPDHIDKEVEFVSDDGKIEVINLDGNDSRSPSPDRDRYNKRRRASRSRSRERGGRSGGDRDRERRRRSRSRSSRSRSPKGANRRRGSSRDRNERGQPKDKDREKEKEKDREYERERRRKGLPDMKKEHLSVCSTTLWVGHLSKLVQQEELSDTFGKYGDIVSIDMIHPRGCAFIVMNRRQDSHKAMGTLKSHKMQGRAITISWAAGKGVKSKEWKDYWDLDLGVSYIPWNKLSGDTDLEALEEGGMFDEDSMPIWMKDKVNQTKSTRENIAPQNVMFGSGLEGLHNLDISQPPPNPAGQMMPPGMVSPFTMGPPVPRMMGPMGIPMPPVLPGMPPMPPNMVPGMPPPGMMPHGMMPPSGMMSGFQPIPPQMDKGIPPPNSGNAPPNEGSSGQPPMPPGGPPPPFMGNMHMPPMPSHMGMPPQFQQPPPNSSQTVNAMMHPGGLPQNDDQMDIEMEDDLPNMNNPGKQQQGGNFNQPPPLFPNFPSDILSGGDNRRNDRGGGAGGDDIDFRDNRNRGGGGDMHGGEFNSRQSIGSRWGGNERAGRDRGERDRNNRDGPPDLLQQQSWQENGLGNFQGPNFNDNGGRPGFNIPPLDITNPPTNPFFDMRRDDFNEDRRGGGGGNGPRDLFSNSRFSGGNNNSGGQLQQMRGGLPQFGPRIGNIFMSGYGSRNGPHGEGGGGNFNHNNFSDRPSFDREDRSGRGGMRTGNNIQERRSGRGNWRDEDDMNERGGGNGGSEGRSSGAGRRGRFQGGRDRDDRGSRDRDRGVRQDRNARTSKERIGGERRSRKNSFNRSDEDKQQSENQTNNNEVLNKQQVQDTEDDWDQELEEFNINPDLSGGKNSVSFNREESELSNQRTNVDGTDDCNEDNQNIFDNQSNIGDMQFHRGQQLNEDDRGGDDNNFTNSMQMNSSNDENLHSEQNESQHQHRLEEAVFVQPAPAEIQPQPSQQHHFTIKIRDDLTASNFNNTPLYDEPNEGSSGAGNSHNQSGNNNTEYRSPFDKEESAGQNDNGSGDDASDSHSNDLPDYSVEPVICESIHQNLPEDE